MQLLVSFCHLFKPRGHVKRNNSIWTHTLGRSCTTATVMLISYIITLFPLKTFRKYYYFKIVANMIIQLITLFISMYMFNSMDTYFPVEVV